MDTLMLGIPLPHAGFGSCSLPAPQRNEEEKPPQWIRKEAP
jgi:hypothetical protein